MRAVTYDRPGRVVVSTVEDPRIEKTTDALVKINVSAICGTDLHALHGLDGITPGTVLGHEFVGSIIAIGSDVQTLDVGDQVLGSDFTACGRCWWCRRGDHWECEERSFFGYGSVFGEPLPGAQAEAVRVPHADVVLCRVPKYCSPDAALFVGDTLACGFAAAERGEVSFGDTVVVIGGGTVGQLTSLACQTMGVASVVVVDLLQSRRDIAAANGSLASSPEDVSTILEALTDGRGADVTIDAVGGAVALRAACDLVRARGTVVSVGAHFDSEFIFPVARAFAKEFTLRFAIGDSIRLRDRILPLLVGGVIDPTVVATSRIPLEKTPESYNAMARQEELKVLIYP